jgi:hypothetical protein
LILLQLMLFIINLKLVLVIRTIIIVINNFCATPACPEGLVCNNVVRIRLDSPFFWSLQQEVILQ